MKRILYRLIMLAVLIPAAACNKWLDLKPQDGIVRDDFWKTKEQVQAGVTGCYASLLGAPDGVTDRPLPEYLFLWGELRADMLAPGTGITNDEQEIINVNILPTNSITRWRAVYRSINYCNTVIDFAPQVLAYDKTFTKEALDAAVAEALGLRSLLYFYLVRSFGDVPLKLTSTSSDDEISTVPKSTQQQVLAQIITDLKTAAQTAAVTYGNRPNDVGRITRYTISAILADVYLWTEQYNECIAECDKLIAAGNFGLIAGSSGWFSTLFYAGNSNEAIFEFQYDAQKLNPFYNMFAIARKRYVAAEKVMEDVYTIDYTDETKADIRGAGAAVRTSDNTIWKYIGANSILARTADASYAHWFVYRYADVLLMKAEACVQVNRGQDALDLIEVIRTRANALEGTAREIDPSDTEAIGEYVLEERAREFAFEGKRWYDLLRYAKRDNYRHLDMLLNIVSQTVPSDRQQSAIAKYRDVNSHYFPINANELLIDKQLVQNPFYQ